MNPGQWIDRLTAPIAPRWTFRRQRARLAAEMFARAYDAASAGRRTSGWRRNSGDVNAVVGQGLERTRDVARDLVRNNPYAASALNTIVDHVVGWGIVPQVAAPTWWKAWAETTACDADGRYDFAGLQKQAVRTMAEAGEVLIRRRWRRPADGLPIPMQLQLLEPDLLDTTKDGRADSGNRIIQGVEFNPIGQRVAYWLFPEHPGSSGAFATFGASRSIPATEILHVFKPERPGQVRGISWLAPIILRLKDFDDYEDAALMKQKIAACLAVIVTDPDGTAPALGGETASGDATKPALDQLYPGMIANFTQGRAATVVQPPNVSEHDAYCRTVLRAIAAGIGITYEDLCGDYAGMPFSAARMSRLRSWARVEDWRWRLMVPQLCDPIWDWAQLAAAVANLPTLAGAPEWTAPAMPAVDPQAEASAYSTLVRIGAMSWPEMLRERGFNPDKVLAEIALWNKKRAALGVILDSDPGTSTQQGGPRESVKATEPAPAKPTPAAANGNGAGARNGHVEDQPAAAAKVRLLELDQADLGERLAQLEARLDASSRPVEHHVHVTQPAAPAAPNVTIEDGAIRAEVHAPPAPNVHVDGPTVNVAPAELRMEAGAIRGGDVHVAPPPPAEVHVDARTTVEKGAIEVPVSVAPPPPAEVRVESHVDAGAVQVHAPVTVQQAPAPPTVTVVRAPARPAVEPGSGVPATDAE